MQWFCQNFDPNWVTCANYFCQSSFVKRSIIGKRKCPKCKMDNRHQIKVPNAILGGAKRGSQEGEK